MFANIQITHPDNTVSYTHILVTWGWTKPLAKRLVFRIQGFQWPFVWYASKFARNRSCSSVPLSSPDLFVVALVNSGFWGQHAVLWRSVFSATGPAQLGLSWSHSLLWLYQLQTELPHQMIAEDSQNWLLASVHLATSQKLEKPLPQWEYLSDDCAVWWVWCMPMCVTPCEISLLRVEIVFVYLAYRDRWMGGWVDGKMMMDWLTVWCRCRCRRKWRCR